jgi:hypothetical protein
MKVPVMQQRTTVLADQCATADYMTRLDFVLLDELGYLPFALQQRLAQPDDY